MKQMRRIALPTVVLVTLLVLLATEVLAGSPFIGVWKSIDLDQSRQTLVIKPFRDKLQVKYMDKGASVCGLDENGKPLYAAVGHGLGIARENTLKALVKLYCMDPEHTFLGKYEFTFEYNPETDTLWDGWVIWNRTR